MNPLLLRALISELKEKLVSGRITHLYSFPPYQVMLVIRHWKNRYYLLIDINPRYPHIRLTSPRKNDFISPAVQTFRKWLVGSWIVDLQQENFDRLVKIYTQKKNPLGEKDSSLLVVELCLRYSNFILLHPESREIIECLRPVTSRENRYREILAGKIYYPPPAPPGWNPLEIAREDFLTIISRSDSPMAGLENFRGISPAMGEEILKLASSLAEREKIWQVFSDIISSLRNQRFSPVILFSPTGEMIEVSVINPKTFPGRKLTFGNMSEAVDFYYSSKEQEEELAEKKKNLQQLAFRQKQKKEKIFKKLEIQLRQIESAELEREKGDLILAHLSEIKKGQERVRIKNLFHPPFPEVEISLDPQLSPQENARVYYQKYARAHRGAAIIRERCQEIEKEISYWDDLLLKIEVLSFSNIENYEKELLRKGYPVKKEKKVLPFRKFISSDGYEILVGKNRFQNDYLTFQIAHPQDMWFHVREAAGSHVIIRNPHRQESIPPRTIKEAASLAASFSRLKKEEAVLVSFTYRRYVRRIPGEKGKVRLEREETLWAVPRLLPITEDDSSTR